MIATLRDPVADPVPGPAPQAPVPLALVIAQHGPWRVLRAALAALMLGQPRPPPLNNHLRRDIGLPELPGAPLDWPWIIR